MPNITVDQETTIINMKKVSNHLKTQSVKQTPEQVSEQVSSAKAWQNKCGQNKWIRTRWNKCQNECPDTGTCVRNGQKKCHGSKCQNKCQNKVRTSVRTSMAKWKNPEEVSEEVKCRRRSK